MKTNYFDETFLSWHKVNALFSLNEDYGDTVLIMNQLFFEQNVLYTALWTNVYGHVYRADCANPSKLLVCDCTVLELK